MKRTLVCLALAVVTGNTPPAPTLAIVRVPNGGIQPEAAVDANGVLHLLYFSGEPRAGNLVYVRSADSGATFSAPVRVNSQEGSAIATGTIRGGHLAVGRDGRVHVAWNGSAAGDAPFLYSRSSRDGRRFEPQRNLARHTYGLDGGGAVAADASGGVYVMWHSLAQGGPDGEARRRVWIARSYDEGATFEDEQPAWAEETGACGCCGMTVQAGAAGRLYALYRGATSPDDRDIFLIVSGDRGRSFRGSRVQGWKIPACPMTSASLAVTPERVLGAWETAGQVYWGTVDANAARIETPVATPGSSGTRKHPRLAIDANGNTLLVWTEDTAWARGGSLHWQQFDRTGRQSGEHGSAAGVPVWSYGAATPRPGGGFVIIY